MTPESQVATLYQELKRGTKVNRAMAFARYGIADLRSRICDVQREFGIIVHRQTMKGKRYKEYFLKSKDDSTLNQSAL